MFSSQSHTDSPRLRALLFISILPCACLKGRFVSRTPSSVAATDSSLLGLTPGNTSHAMSDQPILLAHPVMFSDEQFTALLATIHPPAVIAMPEEEVLASAQGSVAPFIMDPIPTTSKSVCDDFPHVEAGIILDIARHEFRPVDLCKLDSCICDKTDTRSTLDLNNGILTAKPTTGSSRDYPHFTSLLPLLTVYFSILSSIYTGCCYRKAECNLYHYGWTFLLHFPSYWTLSAL
ncbi:hypothetical protein BDQ17DRAFT_1433446 [Cyathus striatus]|nr:hypothetical protein BDQ17DRAFT_1433446 [Cyathus striatus]